MERHTIVLEQVEIALIYSKHTSAEQQGLILYSLSEGRRTKDVTGSANEIN